MGNKISVAMRMKRSQHQDPVQVGLLLTMGAAHEMFPSSWALAVRPKIWAVDGVGPRSVFAGQQWRTLSTEINGWRREIRFRIFRHKTNHPDVYNDDELHARYRFRSQDPFWIAEEIICDLQLANRKGNLL